LSVHDFLVEMKIGTDNGRNDHLIPIARAALADVKRVVADFTDKGDEAARIRDELDARPTLLDGPRRWVEAHAC